MAAWRLVPVGKRAAALGVLVLALVAGSPGSPAGAQESTAVYVGVDRYHLLSVSQEPFTKISLANPQVADVQVLSPTQLLISGKTAGSTGMLVFFASGKPISIDLIVHPGPVVSAVTAPARPEPHVVLIHRGDRVTERLFLRDKSDLWIELGSARDTEPTKK